MDGQLTPEQLQKLSGLIDTLEKEGSKAVTPYFEGDEFDRDVVERETPKFN